MRLATLRTPAGPRAVVRVGERYLDLASVDPALSSVKQILADGLLPRVTAAMHGSTGTFIPVAEAKFHAVVPDPQKVLCIGLNYKDHAAECNLAIPRDPVLFSKFASALIGHGEPIVLPKVSTKVDYEAELVIVVGKRGKHIPVEKAFEYIAGYAVGHDVSARDWQLEKDGKQWMVGKTFDTFAPVGPELVTSDEAGDPHAMPIRLKLNGKVMQQSNTEQFIFGIDVIMAYVSQVFTLEPGDLIFTGTPPGVGMATVPGPVWMKPGDVAIVEIDGLGALENPVVAE